MINHVHVTSFFDFYFLTRYFHQRKGLTKKKTYFLGDSYQANEVNPNSTLKLTTYLVYPGQGNVVEDELQELGETEPVLAPDTEAGDGLTVQLGLAETETRGLRE